MSCCQAGEEHLPWRTAAAHLLTCSSQWGSWLHHMCDTDDHTQQERWLAGEQKAAMEGRNPTGEKERKEIPAESSP